LAKVILQGQLIIPDEDLAMVLVHLPEHVELTRKEPGCLVFEVTQDPTNDNVLNVYEEFKDQQAFAAHQARAKNSRWGSVSANAERHYEITEGPE
jgi:quinol monooxygenase YgiN